MSAPIPFFRAGRSAGDAHPLPLGFISGPLIFDSGEADHTFFYRCQDRYLVYNALAGVRSLLFVIDANHRDRYSRLIANLNRRLDRVSAWTGAPLPPVAAPLMIPLDPDDLAVHDAPFLESHLREPSVRESIARGEILFNQASPTGARLLLEIATLLRRYNLEWDLDADRLRAQGALALWCHDKANYVAVVAASDRSLPAHARSAIVTVEDLLPLGGWSDLAALYTRRTGWAAPPALYVKSACDSGGNVACKVTPDNGAAAIDRLHREMLMRVVWDRGHHTVRLAELAGEIALAPSLGDLRPAEQTLARYLETQHGRRHNVRFLVQEAVDAPSNGGAWHCEGAGITCVVAAAADAEVYSTAGQIYSDADRQHYIGSLLSESAADLALDARADAGVRALAREFGRRGYEGPLNFDARRNDTGQWVFIYDCNPRLSAIYPALATRSCVNRVHGVHTIVSLGYRGEFSTPDLDGLLATLSDQQLLYTVASGRGVLPLPNLARQGGCDLVIVNMSPEEVQEFARTPAIPRRAGTRVVIY